MKKHAMLWTLCMSVGLLSTAKSPAQETGLEPPSDLQYSRIWADSIRLNWNPPRIATETEDPKANEWTELPLQHTATYRLPGNYTGMPHPRNPASDGTYIYLSTWSSSGAASTFYKYDLYGNFVETGKPSIPTASRSCS